MLFNTVKIILGHCIWFLPKRVQLAALTMFLTLAVAHSAYAIPDQNPLFLSNPVKPIMMLNMSKDHQLYFKIYDDYSDITNSEGGARDGVPDTTYVPKYEYYGYFDGNKCYTYNATSKLFEPKRLADASHYCTAGAEEWSGNYLNWAGMTRVDAVRKILYGGLRSIDTTSVTILERALLPHDAHSFAKFYAGSDIAKLTPFSGLTGGITICNTTAATTGYSQSVTEPPLFRVAKGNYSLWASNEVWQCRWNTGDNNKNVPLTSGISANAAAPAFTSSDKLGLGDYVARVKVCVAGLLEENCKQYPAASSAQKPTGLLQEYGETDKIRFGVMTGSYGKNKSGGVLRKAIGSIASEVNLTSGEFTNAVGAIRALNSLRIYGYNYSTGAYSTAAPGDNCPGFISGFGNDQCSNWGNPQSEIYLESLRYLAGKSATPAFVTDDTGKFANLTTVAWGATPPVTAANYCAPLNVIQFNASSSTYDDDELSGATDIGLSNLSAWTNKIGTSTHENLVGSYFTGLSGVATDDGVCSGKPYTSLAQFLGSCPDAPRLKGSYGISGLAYYARQNDINSTVSGSQTVRTFGVALAPAVPSIKIPIPGRANKFVEILPACKSNRTSTIVDGVSGQPATREGNCAIVDFKIVTTDISSSNTENTAKLYVNWEAAEQGNDYDQDMWGTIDVIVKNSEARVTTRVAALSAGASMGFGYVISGTDLDGFKVHSGVRNFVEPGTYCSAAGLCVCEGTNSSNTACNHLADTPQQIYPITGGTTGAKFLPSALALAAKWGGYSDAFVKKTKKQALAEGVAYSDDYLATKIKNRDTSDTYYYATDPRALKDSLAKAFSDVAASVGSAASVATNSTRFSEGSFVYQAQFNSEDWTGALYAYKFDASGKIDEEPSHCTKTLKDDAGVVECAGVLPTNGASRNISTYNGSNRVSFSWANLTTAQKNALKLSGETTDVNAIKRVDWLLGNATHEGTGGGLRERGTGADRNILGDIVNSSPAYAGVSDFRYHKLPGAAGAGYRDFVESKKAKAPRIFVGANDGMVHAFNAETLAEVFAYIPSFAFSKLANLTDPDYGTSAKPHQYIVDGPIAVGDVFINSEWRTIIVGTLGAGGKGIYALDVTDNTPKVLFELNETNYPQMGYVMGRPSIVAMKNGRWAAIFGNGDSSGYSSRLFIIDIEAPTNSAYSKVINAGAGTGLSAPALLPNAIGQIERAYAGDINGNLWRFDLSGENASEWKKDYKVFVAKDDNGNNQPITAPPTLGINSSKGEGTVMAYFGTGKYYDTGDNTSTITPQHSFYAVADIGSLVARNTLLAKTMTTTYGASPKRLVNEANPNWESQNGWYFNFNDAGAIGERVTTKALLLQDYLIFVTLIPSDHACENGGKSWLMQLRAVGNKNVNGEPPLKENVLNEFLVLGNPSFGELVPDPSKMNGGGGGGGGPCSVPGTRPGSILVSGTDGSTKSTVVCLQSEPTGRQSWRQIR